MTHDMTRGSLLPILIKFTIPLVLGNLLQLTYNAADSIIVGRFLGASALAAVGTSNPLVTLIILFEQGICLGTGVLIGMLFGSHQYDRLQRQVSTGMVSGLVFSLGMAALTIVLAPSLLTILQVDSAILDEAVLYLRIVAFGLLFNFIYNYFAGTLRAMGDSRSPLLFLALSAALNVAGDLIFVIVFHMGVVGCAVATVLSEGLSGILCFIYIQRRIPMLQLGKRWLLFDASLLQLTLQYGFVSAMQQCAVQVGKLGIQGIVNTMGVASTAAFSAVNRVDDYAVVIEQNIAHAMTSVMAQNEGAGEHKRVFRAFEYGLVLELIYGVLAGILFYFLAEPIMHLFTQDAEVVTIGRTYLQLIAFMYILPGLTNGIQGYFRGIGDLKVTLFSSMLNMGVRVIAAIPMVFVFHMGMEAIPWSYMLGWIAMIAFELPFFLRWNRDHLMRQVAEESENQK
jgi:putative MATE family efflux protein